MGRSRELGKGKGEACRQHLRLHPHTSCVSSIASASGASDVSVVLVAASDAATSNVSGRRDARVVRESATIFRSDFVAA